jgi:hypothetical protein
LPQTPHLLAGPGSILQSTSPTRRESAPHLSPDSPPWAQLGVVAPQEAHSQDGRLDLGPVVRSSTYLK